MINAVLCAEHLPLVSSVTGISQTMLPGSLPFGSISSGKHGREEASVDCSISQDQPLQSCGQKWKSGTKTTFHRTGMLTSKGCLCMWENLGHLSCVGKKQKWKGLVCWFFTFGSSTAMKLGVTSTATGRVEVELQNGRDSKQFQKIYSLPPQAHADLNAACISMCHLHKLISQHFEDEADFPNRCQVTSKSHALLHICSQSNAISPRRIWCFAGESFLSVSKTLAQNCERGQPPKCSFKNAWTMAPRHALPTFCMMGQKDWLSLPLLLLHRLGAVSFEASYFWRCYFWSKLVALS